MRKEKKTETEKERPNESDPIWPLLSVFYSIIAPHIGWANIAHATEGILADLPKVYQLPSKAENNALTQEDLDLLHSLKEPFYAEACEAMQARVRKELESVKDVRIETTPEVAVDKLFDAIVAPYKGKVSGRPCGKSVWPCWRPT